MTVLDDASGSGNITPSEPGMTLYFHESAGGRFDGNGLLDTHWRMWTVDTADDDASDAGDEANVAGSAASPVPAPAPEKRAATAERGA